MAEHPGVQLHCTPTHSSWLNEICFSKTKSDVIAHGVFLP